MATLFMVLTKPVAAEVVTRYPQYCMDVVRTLPGGRAERHRVFVLDQQGGAMNSVIRRLADLRWTHPRKVQPIEAGILNCPAVCPRDLKWNIAEIFFD